MDNFFTEIGSPESLFLLFVALCTFLIGFITAWAMWGSKANRYQQEAEKWKKSYDDLLVQHNQLREELDLKDADLAKAKREALEAIELTKSLEAEKDKWQKDLDAALEDSVKAQATLSSYQTSIEDLNNQIVVLKSLNAELKAAATGTPPVGSAMADRLDELEAKVIKLQAGHEEEANKEDPELEEVKQSYAEAKKLIESLETQIQELTTENAALKAHPVSENGDSNGNGNEPIFAPSPEKADVDKGETVTLSAVAARDEILAASGKQWPVASEENKDDLTRIKGIGTFLEKKLNDLGIYTYEQISKLDHHWIERLTAAIEFFPGRIERDDWVGQATRLMSIKEEAPEALAPTAVFSKNMEDLKIVEGIGPKIEQLLKDNGIADLNALAQAEENRLREILTNAGKRFRIHEPSSWPQQAELATQEKWDELKELQDRLIGGREPV